MVIIDDEAGSGAQVLTSFTAVGMCVLGLCVYLINCT